MKRTIIPVERLFAWARLNGAEFNQVDISLDITSIDGVFKGAGLVNKRADGAEDDRSVLLSVPQDLVLSQEQVERYASIDKNLRLILDAADAVGRTARGAILIFMLVQITIASPDFDGPVSVTNPHTDYIKLLPANVLLPTFYTEEEKNLLFGTSLQDALDQKLRNLEKEFEQLHEGTRSVPWCQRYWWDEDSGRLTFEDWVLVDALYRSRALDLPGTGHAMVPCIDMANHAFGIETVALYETDSDGRAILQRRANKNLIEGEEVTITYGDEKGACEMIYSYGFIESAMLNAKVIFLDLDVPEDDPLRLAKKTVNKDAPGVRLFVGSDGQITWDGNFIWWACLNEEDGLDFRIAQLNDGERELELLWNTQHIDPSHLPRALENDPRWEIFRLRAVVLLQERVSLQISYLEASDSSYAGSQGQPGVRDLVWTLIGRLRALEGRLLFTSYQALEEQKTDLLNSETVKRYLQAAQADLNPVLSVEAGEEDFS